MLALLVLVAGIVGYSILNGWVTSILWGWFIVPLGAPTIGIANAIGLALFVGLFVNRQVIAPTEGETDTNKSVVKVVLAVLFPFIALGIGWIIHQFQ